MSLRRRYVWVALKGSRYLFQIPKRCMFDEEWTNVHACCVRRTCWCVCVREREQRSGRSNTTQGRKKKREERKKEFVLITTRRATSYVLIINEQQHTIIIKKNTTNNNKQVTECTHHRRRRKRKKCVTIIYHSLSYISCSTAPLSLVPSSSPSSSWQIPAPLSLKGRLFPLSFTQ